MHMKDLTLLVSDDRQLIAQTYRLLRQMGFWTALVTDGTKLPGELALFAEAGQAVRLVVIDRKQLPRFAGRVLFRPRAGWPWPEAMVVVGHDSEDSISSLASKLGILSAPAVVVEAGASELPDTVARALNRRAEAESDAGK